MMMHNGELKSNTHPCDICDRKDSCDTWEAKFCCALCYYYSDEPDCDNCDPTDI